MAFLPIDELAPVVPTVAAPSAPSAMLQTQSALGDMRAMIDIARQLVGLLKEAQPFISMLVPKAPEMAPALPSAAFEVLGPADPGSVRPVVTPGRVVPAGAPAADERALAAREEEAVARAQLQRLIEERITPERLPALVDLATLGLPFAAANVSEAFGVALEKNGAALREVLASLTVEDVRKLALKILPLVPVGDLKTAREALEAHLAAPAAAPAAVPVDEDKSKGASA